MVTPLVGVISDLTDHFRSWASRSYRVHVTSINKKFEEASLCTVNFAKWLQFRLIGGFRFLLVVKGTKLFAMNYLKGINFCEN